MGDSHARMAMLIENASRAESENALYSDEASQTRTATSTLAEFFATTGPEDTNHPTQIVAKSKKANVAMDFLLRRKPPTTTQTASATPKSVITKVTTNGVRYQEIKSGALPLTHSAQKDNLHGADAITTANYYTLMRPTRHESNNTTSTQSCSSGKDDAVFDRQPGTDNSWSSSLSDHSYDPNYNVATAHQQAYNSALATSIRKQHPAQGEKSYVRPRPVQRVSDDAMSSYRMRTDHVPMTRSRTLSRSSSSDTVPRHELRNSSDVRLEEQTEELRRPSAASDDSEISLSHSLKLLQAISERGANDRHQESLQDGLRSDVECNPASISASPLKKSFAGRSSTSMPRIVPPQSITALLRNAAASQKQTKRDAYQVRSSIEERMDENRSSTRNTSELSDVLLYGQMEHAITSGAPVLLYKQVPVSQAPSRLEKPSSGVSHTPCNATREVQRERDSFAERLQTLEARNQRLEEALTSLLADRNAKLA
ncbi:protein of unknown function [Taphrina deformans PYCC 5710]|uniref:Uncharacterized protein n=1 Tax=Taphrina deformans (strain PYCC 5710 / ATCC 11124 / CBS 356.35 / IMI 108563 / JCM 9778 / NBRC 8474) TaxID=1097556 RepID=R4X7M6_TAPDE|nr:protein of unknown function [Taphrina deformans PYCC 5710]|eukprot:CCG81148.1 protein of unknown function [Taphrina deformans PYCC 5710]